MKQTTLFLLSGAAAMLATIAVLLRLHSEAGATEPSHFGPAWDGIPEPSGDCPLPDLDFSPDAFREELLK